MTENTNPDFQLFAFGGGVYDSHTKLVQFGERDYDASTGRWTTQDPMLFGGGDWNLYRYAASDPVNVLDASGESIIATQMLNDEKELAKLGADGGTQALSRQKELRRLLCKNGATLLDRYSRLKGKLERFQMHHVLQDAKCSRSKTMFRAQVSRCRWEITSPAVRTNSRTQRKPR